MIRCDAAMKEVFQTSILRFNNVTTYVSKHLSSTAAAAAAAAPASSARSAGGRESSNRGKHGGGGAAAAASALGNNGATAAVAEAAAARHSRERLQRRLESLHHPSSGPERRRAVDVLTDASARDRAAREQQRQRERARQQQQQHGARDGAFSLRKPSSIGTAADGKTRGWVYRSVMLRRPSMEQGFGFGLETTIDGHQRIINVYVQCEVR